MALETATVKPGNATGQEEGEAALWTLSGRSLNAPLSVFFVL